MCNVGVRSTRAVELQPGYVKVVVAWNGRGSVRVVEDRDTPQSLKLFHANLELVERIARQVARTLNRPSELDELRSFGREGLLLAARRFDPTHGVPFRGYASYRVRGAMIDGVRRACSLPRRTYEKLRLLETRHQFSEHTTAERIDLARSTGRSHAQQALDDYLARAATAMAIGLIAECARSDAGEPVAVSAEEPADDKLARAELLRAVVDEVGRLPLEEAHLIRRHYFEGERFDHVAAELGLSKSWASRLHTRAIARLAKRFSQPFPPASGAAEPARSCR